MPKEQFGIPSAPQETPKEKLSLVDGHEVLRGIEVTEGNLEFAQKISEIATEMDNRKLILGVNHDSGEKKFSNKSELDVLKEKIRTETRQELTKTSKYVKGAIGAGILAVMANYAPTVVEGLNSSVENMQWMTEHGTWSEGMSEMWDWAKTGAVSIPVFAASSLFALQRGYKAIRQEIKTRVASNIKLQRVFGMVAAGANPRAARNVVSVESRQFASEDARDVYGNKMKGVDVESGRAVDYGRDKRDIGKMGGYLAVDDLYEDAVKKSRDGSDSVPRKIFGGLHSGDAQSPEDYFGMTHDDMKAMREKLNEMGIPRIDRSKYKA